MLKRKTLLAFTFSVLWSLLLFSQGINNSNTETFTSITLPAIGGSVNYSTSNEYKNAIIEEFTGVMCPYCPAANVLGDSLISIYNGDVNLIRYHMSNFFSAPLDSNDQDFRRSYPDQYFNYSGATGIPAALINRRTWGFNRNVFPATTWGGNSDVIINEKSPVNIGASSNYNASTNMLDVTVELYYTQNVPSTSYLYVHLMEDSLFATQAMDWTINDTDYMHHNVYRETLSDTTFDGTLITEATNANTLVTRSFTFDMSNAKDSVNMNNAELLIFVMGDVTTVGQEELSNTIGELSTYPNPSNGTFTVKFPQHYSGEATLNVTNALGQSVVSKTVSTFNGQINLNLEIPPGLYLVSLAQDSKKNTTTILIR